MGMRDPSRGVSVAAFAVAAGFGASAPAWAGLEQDLVALAEAAPEQHVVLRDALVHDAGVTSDDLAVFTVEGQPWSVRLEAEAVLAWRASPDWAVAAWSALPSTTRAGFWRFTDSALTDPSVTPILLERFVHGGEHAELRGALLEVVARTTGPGGWEAPFAAWLATEPSAYVREAAIHGLRDGDATIAIPALVVALGDSSSRNRAEAARSLGAHPGGAAAAAALGAALADPSPEVRAAAVRSCGVLKVGSAWEGVGALLRDADAEVRLQALHAAERIDPARAPVAAAPLEQDPDPRVSRLAARLIGGAR